MAILSPALVVAMCVMFVITRMHRHFYIIEYPLLFGLKYCVEPNKKDLAAIVQAESKNSQSKKTKGKQTASSSKQKVKTVRSLPVGRLKISELFFSAESEFPHHREIAHLTAVFSAYFVAFLFEDVLDCFSPSLLQNQRSVYVAVLLVAFASYEGYQISANLTSHRIMIAFSVIAWIIVLLLQYAGDFQNFIKFDTAFNTLTIHISNILSNREALSISSERAHYYAQIVSFFTRGFLALTAAVIAASTAVSARFFSKIDYQLNRQYRMYESDHQDDPYLLPPPSSLTMIRIALDYVVPLMTAFLSTSSPRDEHSYGAWRIAALVLCVILRLSMARIRLQAYLDGAIDAYRKFWFDKSATGVLEAGRRCTFQVVGTSFFLMLTATSYMTPAIIPLALAMVAKHDGGFRPQFCARRMAAEAPLEGVFGEIASFLAWWSITTYAVVATLSFLVCVAVDQIDPSAGGLHKKLPRPTSASEKRRERRFLQDKLMAQRLKPASAT